MQSTPFVKAFTVIIQFGAILSVVCLYWRRFFYPETMKTHGYTWWQAIWRFYLRLIVGVIPAVVLGLAFNDFIESNLGNVMLVAVMLIVGGVFMLFCDRIFNKGTDATPLTYKRSFVIGLVQCISMIPGRIALDGDDRRRHVAAPDAQGGSRIQLFPCRPDDAWRDMP